MCSPIDSIHRYMYAYIHITSTVYISHLLKLELLDRVVDVITLTIYL